MPEVVTIVVVLWCIGLWYEGMSMIYNALEKYFFITITLIAAWSVGMFYAGHYAVQFLTQGG